MLNRMCLLVVVLSVITTSSMFSQRIYEAPTGGWAYDFDAATAAPGAGGFTALDGTWNHDNGSDEWDGSGLGGTFGTGNRPGGISALVEDTTTFLRLQDTGNPTLHGFADPGSNRKIYLGHSITADGFTTSILDEGVTISFRARVATSGLDPQYPSTAGNGENNTVPGGTAWAPERSGYLGHDGGKGNFSVRQLTGDRVISFSLVQSTDLTGALAPYGTTGLNLNSLNGGTPSGTVDPFDSEGTRNVVPMANVTDAFHEFWCTIVADTTGGGTHRVEIYHDGALSPQIFHVTAGNGDDFAANYIAFGVGATPQQGAIDVDFMSYKTGVHVPLLSVNTNSPPRVTNLTPPNNSIFQPAANGLSFHVTTLDPNTIPPGNIQLILNGSNVSAGLNISGTATDRAVSYNGLVANVIYNGTIIVSDAAGRFSTNTFKFDTLDSATSLVIDAEDYNYDATGLCDPVFGALFGGPGGDFQDNAPPGAYANFLGVPETDYHDSLAPIPPNPSNPYRPCDGVGTRVSSDLVRPEHASAMVPDYEIWQLAAGDWMNYTRTFPAQNYRVYLRAAATTPRLLTLSAVTSSRSDSNQTTLLLGEFDVPVTSRFDYTPLSDAVSSLPVVLGLSGIRTFKLTAANTANDVSANFLVFVPTTEPVTAIGPIVVSRSPAPDATNVRRDTAIDATIQNRATSVNVGTIQLRVDNVNVTASTTITPTGTGATVHHQPAAPFAAGSVHNVQLSYNDNLGNPFSDTWSFTTSSDVTGPTLVFAKARLGVADDYTLTVTFSEGVGDATALQSGNYQVNNGATVGSVARGRDSQTVVISGGGLVDDMFYTLTVNNVQDLAGNPIAANTTAMFRAVRSLIASVVETGGDGEPASKFTGQTFDHANLGAGYTVPFLGEDVGAFTDRAHQWNGAATAVRIPYYLDGSEYIMSRNDNRDNYPFQMDVTITANADVYLLIDNRLRDGDGGNPPSFGATNMQWVLDQGWQPVRKGLNRSGSLSLPDEVGVDEAGDGVGPGAGLNQWASVYTKSFGTGTFSLFQAENPGRNMYGVVVTPSLTIGPLTLQITGSNQATVSWSGPGRLQAADSVTGPWQEISGAVSPHPVTLSGAKFYRLTL